jgi:hypothetical protein
VTERVRWRLRGGVVGAIGTEPSLSFGLVGGAGVRWKALSIGLEGHGELPTSRPAMTGGTVSAWLLAGTLDACFHWGVGLVCGLGTLGALHGSGSEVAHPKEAVTLFASTGARLGVEIPLTRALAWTVYGDGAVTLVRAHLLLNGTDVWTAPAGTGTLGAGLVVSFP